MGQRFAAVPVRGRPVPKLVRGRPARMRRKSGGTPAYRNPDARATFSGGTPAYAIGQIVALIYNFLVIPPLECQS